jgi:hypothetical protein
MMMNVSTEIAMQVNTASMSRRPIYISMAGLPSCAFPPVVMRPFDPFRDRRDTYRAA